MHARRPADTMQRGCVEKLSLGLSDVSFVLIFLMCLYVLVQDVWPLAGVVLVFLF